MTLQHYITLNDWDSCVALNILQSDGIVSDNCVTVADVDPADHAKAIAHLQQQPRRNNDRATPGRA